MTTPSDDTGAVPPRRPTADDAELLAFARRFELTAAALYRTALDEADLPDAHRHVFSTLRLDHDAYADALGAMLGVEAPRHLDDERFDELIDDFSGDADTVTSAAYQLESVAVATHLDLTGRFAATEPARLVASMLLVEAQHSTVLADLGGSGDDLEALLDNPASSVAPAGTTPDEEADA